MKIMGKKKAVKKLKPSEPVKKEEVKVCVQCGWDQGLIDGRCPNCGRYQ